MRILFEPDSPSVVENNVGRANTHLLDGLPLPAIGIEQWQCPYYKFPRFLTNNLTIIPMIKTAIAPTRCKRHLQNTQGFCLGVLPMRRNCSCGIEDKTLNTKGKTAMTAVVRVAKPRPTHSDRFLQSPTVKNVPKRYTVAMLHFNQDGSTTIDVCIKLLTGWRYEDSWGKKS